MRISDWSSDVCSSDLCTYFYKNDNRYPDDLEQQVNKALATIEDLVGATFGDAKNPLLISVRSGARASMPGMMDTVLNLGLNDETVEGLAKAAGRSEEHTSELQSLMRISYAVFCLK